MSELKSQQYIIGCLRENSVEMESSYGKVFFNCSYRNGSRETYQMGIVHVVKLFIMDAYAL